MDGCKPRKIKSPAEMRKRTAAIEAENHWVAIHPENAAKPTATNPAER
jgi:hypothetical protein